MTARRALVGAVLLLAAGRAAAGTRLHHEIIGYSVDRRYLAVQLSGTQEGSGDATCEVEIVDLHTSALAERPISAQQGMEKSGDACAAARAKAARALAARGIVEGDKGVSLWRLPPPGPDGAQRPTPDQLSFEDSCVARSCTLQLTQQEGTPAPAGWVPVEYQLTLRCGKQKVALPCGGINPGTRCDSLGAGLAEVQVAGNYLVAILDVESPGSEGADVTPVVTAARVPGGDVGASCLAVKGAASRPAPATVRAEALVPLGFGGSGAFGYCRARATGTGGEVAAELRVIRPADGTEALKLVQPVRADTLPEACTVLRQQQGAGLEKAGLTAIDAGQERYTSGTARHTAFEAEGFGRVEVDLKTRSAGAGKEQAVDVVLTQGGKPRTIFSGSGGYAYSLNSVLLSRQGTLAVILKHSVADEGGGEHREYKIAVAALGR